MADLEKSFDRKNKLENASRAYPDYFVEPMAVCGDTLYISDHTTIYSFDLRTGAEKVAARNPQ